MSELTKEQKALGAFLAAMHDCGHDGAKMREAMLGVLGLTSESAEQREQGQDDLDEHEIWPIVNLDVDESGKSPMQSCIHLDFLLETTMFIRSVCRTWTSTLKHG